MSVARETDLSNLMDQIKTMKNLRRQYSSESSYPGYSSFPRVRLRADISADRASSNASDSVAPWGDEKPPSSKGRRREASPRFSRRETYVAPDAHAATTNNKTTIAFGKAKTAQNLYVGSIGHFRKDCFSTKPLTHVNVPVKNAAAPKKRW